MQVEKLDEKTLPKQRPDDKYFRTENRPGIVNPPTGTGCGLLELNSGQLLRLNNGQPVQLVCEAPSGATDFLTLNTGAAVVLNSGELIEIVD
jgi:hypothetical protein